MFYLGSFCLLCVSLALSFKASFLPMPDDLNHPFIQIQGVKSWMSSDLHLALWWWGFELRGFFWDQNRPDYGGLLPGTIAIFISVLILVFSEESSNISQ